MEVMRIYLDSKDINRYVHTKLSPADAEKYKDTYFFAYKSEVNNNDMSVDIYLVATSDSDGEKVRRSKMTLEDYEKSITEAEEQEISQTTDSQ